MWKIYQRKPRRFKITYATYDKIGVWQEIYCDGELALNKALDKLSENKEIMSSYVSELLNVDYEK